MTNIETKSLEKLLAAALTGLLIAGTAFFAFQPTALQSVLHGVVAQPIYDFKL
jgi:hypothetical protein